MTRLEFLAVFFPQAPFSELNYEIAVLNKFAAAYNDFVASYSEGMLNVKKARSVLRAWKEVTKLGLWPKD